MILYIFQDGYGVMAESEEAARQTVRDQWSDECVGDPEDAAKCTIIQIVTANKLVMFFC